MGNVDGVHPPLCCCPERKHPKVHLPVQNNLFAGEAAGRREPYLLTKTA